MKAIEILSIPVTDQQAAKTFYLKLGFEIIVEATSKNKPGSRWHFPARRFLSLL